jgi:DNA-binding SARP family transcriptional activator
MVVGAISRVQLCGQFAVIAGGNRIDARLPGRRGRLLVAYLAGHRRQPCSRDELIDALWPEGAADAAAATLTVLLSRVRALLGPATLQGRGALQLILPADAIIDVEMAAASLHQAESAVALGEWRRAWSTALAAQLTAGRTYLAGYDAPWIDDERARLDLLHQAALTAYSEACLSIGGTELPGAERTARQIIARAPLSETGYRLLMLAQAARSDISSALRTYEQLRTILAAELGADPCAEVRDLHQQLLVTGR